MKIYNLLEFLYKFPWISHKWRPRQGTLSVLVKMSETNFSKAKSAFEKALTIEQFNLTDASEAIEFKDIKEMNLCLETISSSVTDLEAKLAAALRIAADDDASEVDEIKKWRSEQKKGIHSMKSMIKT